MAEVTMSLEEYQALINSLASQLNLHQEPSPFQKETAAKPKPKRKVSKYNREFGRQLKALKKKHPRSKSAALMKRAHTLTKKALK